MRMLSILGLAAFALAAATASAQAPPDSAVNGPRANVGNGSGGSGGSREANVVSERAMALARASGRRFPSVEQMVLALLEDAGVRDALVTQHVDVVSLRATLEQYVANQPRGEPAAPTDPLGRDQTTQNVTTRVMLKSIVENRHVAPMDYVTQTLVEGNSFAARTLAEHGLTVQGAENAAVERYLAAQKLTQSWLAETQRKIAAEPRTASSQVVLEASIGQSQSGPVGPRDYTLRITSGGPKPMRFKAAVSHDGFLDLYIESTPFETKFSAHQVVALYEAVEDGDVTAELFANVDGVQQQVSSTRGSAGAIFEDLYEHFRQRSGLLR